MGPDLGYPCTVEFPDGRLLTVYYQQVGHEIIAESIVPSGHLTGD